MLRPVALLIDREGALVEPLGLGVTPLCFLQQGQTVE
jgi:hypothetical protein